MKHQISTATTGDEWTQTLLCTFANSTITELVWEDIRKGYRGHKECLLVGASIKAELQREGKTITATCGRREHHTIHWDADPNTNQEALLALAQGWEQQEKKWLPVMRYFQIAKKKHKDSLREWGKELTDRLGDLENEIKNERLERKGHIKFFQGQTAKLRGKCLGRGHRLNDIEEALSLHRDLPFHFMDRKGGEK